MSVVDRWPAYPGGDLISAGLAAYSLGLVTDESLVVSIIRPRLLRHGLALEDQPALRASPNEQLYRRLEERRGNGAHSAYNALLRRATSFCAALDRG